MTKWQWTDYIEEDNMDFVYDDVGNVIETNLVTESFKVNDIIQYDNKIAPFRFCKAPKWYLTYHYSRVSGFHNNSIVKISNNNMRILYTYEYEYDNDGFPTKRISRGNGNELIEIFTYITK